MYGQDRKDDRWMMDLIGVIYGILAMNELFET